MGCFSIGDLVNVPKIRIRARTGTLPGLLEVHLPPSRTLMEQVLKKNSFDRISFQNTDSQTLNHTSTYFPAVSARIIWHFQPLITVALNLPMSVGA